MTQDKLIQNSVIQSSFNYFCECLEEFRKQQPAFKYVVNYATNNNDEFDFKPDHFNFLVYSGIPDLIPSHWQTVNGEDEILYAGYEELAIAVINPVPIKYTKDIVIHTEDSVFYDEEYSDQVDYNDLENLLSEDSSRDIEYGFRLLEAFSRFMRRRGVLIDEFKFSSECSAPTPDGQFENGYYRLETTLSVQLKFALQNTLGKALYSGEDLRVWIKSGSKEYQEIYNVLEFSPTQRLVDKTYPLINKETTITTGNQISRSLSINCPEFDFAGNKLLKDMMLSGDINSINTCYMIYFDGKKYNRIKVVPTDYSNPYEIDRFNGIAVNFAISSNIDTFDTFEEAEEYSGE